MAKQINEIVNDWRFSSEHVDLSISSGKFVSSKTILLVAIDNIDQVVKAASSGRAAMEVASQTLTGTPIGVVTNWTINQQKQLQQLFEVGSGIPYFVPGNTTSQLGMTRVIYAGGTILGNLYNFQSDSQEWLKDEDKKEAGFLVPDQGDEGMKNQWFAINLAAKAFDRPTTLLWMIKNNRDAFIGAYLFKNAFIEAHSITSDSSSIIIMENASMRFEAAFPVTANPHQAGI